MFSVVIPVHNKLPHLDRAINSVLNQTFSEFEIILIDDASTDGSRQKIEQYKDPRIRVFMRDTPGPGGYAARNLGINNAKYEWVAFLDADDKWESNCLYEYKNAINQNQSLEIISAKWVYSTDGKLKNVEALNKIQTNYFKFSLADYFNNNLIIWTSAVAIKKSLLMNVGGFPEGKCRRSGDMDTWIRCLIKSAGNLFINKCLAIYYRDTVNRVTDFKHNPSLDFCPLETIKDIQAQTNDDKLLSAIDNFCAKHLLTRIIKELRATQKVNTSSLEIIKSRKITLEIIFKVYLYKILMFLNLK